MRISADCSDCLDGSVGKLYSDIVAIKLEQIPNGNR